MIPLTKPVVEEEDLRFIGEVLQSGWLTQGTKVAEFEAALANVLEAKHVVAVSSCTAALHLAVLLAGLGPEDEVIVPSYTFVATVNALLYVGVTPVFAEIDSRTFNLDASRLENYLTHRTKAVIVVDQFGLPADINAITYFCHQHNLQLIEDAACAIGASYKDHPIGKHGRFVTFSFHPRKCITTGEGGILVTDDSTIFERARMLRSHGIMHPIANTAKNTTSDTYLELGYNYRLSDIHCAIGLAQLNRLAWILSRRRQLAYRYSQEFKTLGWLDIPYEPEGTLHTYQSYVVLLKKNAPIKRNILIRHLADLSIASRPGIPPVHKQPYITRKFNIQTDLAVTDDVSERSLILPLYPQMSEEEQDIVINAIKGVRLE